MRILDVVVAAHNTTPEGFLGKVSSVSVLRARHIYVWQEGIVFLPPRKSISALTSLMFHRISTVSTSQIWWNMSLVAKHMCHFPISTPAFRPLDRDGLLGIVSRLVTNCEANHTHCHLHSQKWGSDAQLI
jgi:hypothetical protein